MKHTRNMIRKPSDEARELFLYTINTGRIYKRIEAVVDCLRKHNARGNYDPEKAIDAFYHVATDAAKMYAREFFTIGARPFTVTERYTAAAEMVEYYEDDILG